MKRRAAAVLCVLGAAACARRAAAAQQCATANAFTWDEGAECVAAHPCRTQPPLQLACVRNPELSSAHVHAHTQAALVLSGLDTARHQRHLLDGHLPCAGLLPELLERLCTRVPHLRGAARQGARGLQERVFAGGCRVDHKLLRPHVRRTARSLACTAAATRGPPTCRTWRLRP